MINKKSYERWMNCLNCKKLILVKPKEEILCSECLIKQKEARKKVMEVIAKEIVKAN